MSAMSNKDALKAWVAALRSGEYKQGRHVLRSLEDRFCCLGVLCDLYCKAVKPLNVTEVHNDENAEYVKDYYKYNECSGALPSEVNSWVGYGLNENKLINMNDAGKSFDEIANYIEKEYINA